MSENAEILKIEKTINASCEVLFSSWTSPEALKQWHCGTVSETIMELKVGGQFLIRFEPEEHCDHQVVRGEYLEVTKPTRIKYTWKWDGAEMQDSIVTIDFTEQEPGKTLMSVTHERLETQKSRDDHGMGWEACLVGLSEFLVDSKIA